MDLENPSKKGTENEINVIIADKASTIKYVIVINKVNIGSNHHRTVVCRVKLDFKIERNKVIFRRKHVSPNRTPQNFRQKSRTYSRLCGMSKNNIENVNSKLLTIIKEAEELSKKTNGNHINSRIAKTHWRNVIVNLK